MTSRLLICPMTSFPIRKKSTIVTVYALCFALGSMSHAKDFLVYGWRPYNAAPLPIEVFWSSLILVDLVVVGVLLSKHKRLGAILAISVMLTDVLINTYATIVLEFDILVGPLVLQSIFLGFILGTIGLVFQPLMRSTQD